MLGTMPTYCRKRILIYDHNNIFLFSDVFQNLKSEVTINLLLFWLLSCCRNVVRRCKFDAEIC